MRRNGGWAFVCWVERPGGGRRQVWRSGFRTKRDAQAAERRFLVEAEDRSSAEGAPSSEGPTVGAFLADWLVQSAPTRRASTTVGYRTCIERYVLPHLADVPLRDLGPTEVREWEVALLATPKQFRGGTLSSTTVLMCHRVLRRALQDALRWGLVERNVCDAVVPPRRSTPEMVTWTPDETRHFLAAVAGDRLEAMWRLLVATGMRRSEVAGVPWKDVDLDDARLAVRQTRVLVYDQATVSEPKTRRSRRAVALDAGTVEALRAHRRRQADERVLAAEVWVPSGYVFVREDGLPIDPDRISHLFAQVVAAAGLPRIRLHDLRHTSATLALSAGLHPKVVSERLGHSSIAITLDTYSHVLPSMQVEAAAALGSILDAPPAVVTSTPDASAVDGAT
jgi:integrase